MNEITIVTGFFDIGRGNFSILSRSNDKYFEYFKFWARINNQLLIYTTSEFAAEILNIRISFGLESKTKVIIVEEPFKQEAELFQKMNEVSSDNEFKKNRFFPNALSNDAAYDYVMLLKYWCLRDSVENNYARGMLAWVDFGMNHGGKCYSNPKEFDFLWKTNLDSDKIHLFALKHPDTINSLDLMHSQSDCITGYLLLVPDSQCQKLWMQIKDAMHALLMLDCIDDDQMLLLMAYKRFPTLFQVHICDWFMAMKVSGAKHLTVLDSVIAVKSFDIKGFVGLIKLKLIKELEYLSYIKNIYIKMKHIRKI